MVGYMTGECEESHGAATEKGKGRASSTLISRIPVFLMSAVLGILGALHELLISFKSNQHGFLSLATRRI